MNINLYIHSSILNQGFIVPKNLTSNCSVKFRSVPGTKLYIPDLYFVDDDSKTFTTFNSGDFSFDIVIPEIENEENIVENLDSNFKHEEIPKTLSELCYRLNIRYPGQEWNINIESCLGIENVGFQCQQIEDLIKPTKYDNVTECKRVPIINARHVVGPYFNKGYESILKDKYIAIASFKHKFKKNILSISNVYNRELYEKIKKDIENKNEILIEQGDYKPFFFYKYKGEIKFYPDPGFRRDKFKHNFIFKEEEILTHYINNDEIYMFIYNTTEICFVDFFEDENRDMWKHSYNVCRISDTGLEKFDHYKYNLYINENFRSYKDKFIDYITKMGNLTESQLSELSKLLNDICSYDVIVIPFDCICNLVEQKEIVYENLYNVITDKSHIFTT